MDRRAQVLCAVIALLSLAGCSKKDPEEVEFDKRFRREAVLVKTCPPDPATGTGPGAIKVYRFQDELWFHDAGVLRRVDAKPENVCGVFQVSK
jgi:predicted component of type VI protein secretion system